MTADKDDSLRERIERVAPQPPTLSDDTIILDPHYANLKKTNDIFLRQFQRETLRTSELTALLVKFVEHVSPLLKEAEALLNKPINVDAEGGAK